MIPRQLRLLNDPDVLKLPIQECGEPLLDLLTTTPEIRVDTTRDHVQKLSDSISKLRASVIQKLQQAQKNLPAGIFLLLKEGHRPLSVQKALFEKYHARLASLFPAWDQTRLFAETCKFVAPPDIIPPHSTGGAVDLTLCGPDGRALDLGTDFNANPVESLNATYTLAGNIPTEARKNREILIQVISQAGFVNFPTEWWHWSYGDRYWAFHTGAPCAIYDSI